MKNEQKKQTQIFRRIFVISALCLPLKAGDALDQIQMMVNLPSTVGPGSVVTVEKDAALDLSQHEDTFQLGGRIDVYGTLNVGEREVTGYPADFPKETGVVTYGTINFDGTLGLDAMAVGMILIFFSSFNFTISAYL